MKPILFNTPMTQATQEDRKTVTRRVIKYSCPAKPGSTLDDFIGAGDPQLLVGCSPYQPGDILWVRETWGVYCQHWWEADRFEYRASFKSEDTPFGMTEPPKWHPSIHMPKEAARLFLRVTDVRVERLQAITPVDCIREGVERTALEEVGGEFARGMFHDIWDTTIKPADLPLYGWEANPRVRVIEFERISKEEAVNAD